MQVRSLRRMTAGMVVCVGTWAGASGCGTDDAARRSDVEALAKELRAQRERQVKTERQLADLDTRMALLADRLGRAPAGPATAEGRGPAARDPGRPALGVVKLEPRQRRTAEAPPPSQDDDEAPVIELPAQQPDDGTGGSGDDALTLGVDRSVLKEASAPGEQALSSREEEVVARTDAKSQYALAMRHYKARQYAQAARGFEELSDRWPDHALADNALYWTGVCYLQMGEVALAINELQKVPVRHPRSDKVPDALFQLSEAYQRAGDVESAKAMLTQVVQMYPRAEAAGAAKESLARINAAK